MNSPREKVAILGAGPAGLTTAFHLTSTPELRDRFEITIYEMSWRAGGKGRSGRDEDGRILEHGLHVLFGCYHLFFSMMRQVYAELDRPEGHPVRTWRDAFEPHEFGMTGYDLGERWDPWCLTFPRNGSVPGEAGERTLFVPPDESLSMFIQAAIHTLFGWKALSGAHRAAIFRKGGRKWVPRDAGNRLGRLILRAFNAAYRRVHALHRRSRAEDARAIVDLLRLRKHVHAVLNRKEPPGEHMLRMACCADHWIAVISGAIADGVLLPGGWARVDEFDFREWLERHGAHPRTIESPWGRTIYDAAFSYENGDPERQRIAAGSALRALIGLCTYKGAMYYKMTAGMGDIVFAPLYQVLVRRGVKFEFFHRVDRLELSADESRVEAVHMERQAIPKGGQYQPLVDFGGLECWPAEPLWERLEGPARPDVDFESYYSGHRGPPLTLRAGRDFDRLVFAIPIGAVPFVCAELVAAKPRWQRMVEHVKSVQTLSVQLWTKPSLAQLGWSRPPTLMSLYRQPLNTWVDMSQVLWAEPWAHGAEPGGLVYLCGAQKGPAHPPPPSAAGFEREMTESARVESLEFIERHLPALFQRATDASGAGPAFDWGVLVDRENRHGAARFAAQYVRSNCGPSDRCTIALPGTNKYRLEAGDTGFDNLTIAGDWIDNGFYVASMESTVQSGVLAARAVSGVAFTIVDDWFRVTRGPLHPEEAASLPSLRGGRAAGFWDDAHADLAVFHPEDHGVTGGDLAP